MMLTAMCMTTGTTRVTKAVHRKMKDTLLRQRRTRSANILFLAYPAVYVCVTGLFTSNIQSIDQAGERGLGSNAAQV